jgi:23S rRNA pseudouridine955/2504/2580 synthase
MKKRPPSRSSRTGKPFRQSDARPGRPPRGEGRPEGRSGRTGRSEERPARSGRSDDRLGRSDRAGKPFGKPSAGKSFGGKSAGKLGGARRQARPEKPSWNREDDRPAARSPVNPNRSKRPPKFGKPEGDFEGGGERPRVQSQERDAPYRSERAGRRPRAEAVPASEEKFERAPREEKPAAPQQAVGVQTVTVSADENGMRIDRFLEAKFPGLSFSHIQRVVRKGELRVDGKRADSKDRLETGQKVRIPPLKVDAPRPRGTEGDEKTREFLKSITLHEDADVMVLNKPMGLAVQGGSGMVRHIDGMLEVLQTRDGQRPRLVHRLDRDTSGCLLIAKTRFAAAALAKTFRTRSARKLYWALVPGVPKPKQGRISTFLAKDEREDESLMRIAKHGEEGASHAVTYYAVVESAGQQISWVSLKPVTGRTHQLRAHMAHIDHAIIGDAKYFNKENWNLPGGMQNKLHLLARRIVVPHPRGGVVDITAPLPPHMAQSWNLLGFDATRYDPIVESPEE